VIDGGRIIERGTHSQLLEQQGFYRHLYLSQFKGQLTDSLRPLAAVAARATTLGPEQRGPS